jgi:hypothetical protein
MGLRATIYAREKYKPNTFIGGVSASINTPELLAVKIGISPSRIKLFTVIGNDIQFAIVGGSYTPIGNLFNQENGLTYYIDVDGLISSNWAAQNSLSQLLSGSNNNLTEFYWPKATAIYETNANWTFQMTSGNYPYLKIMYFPMVINWGSTQGYNSQLFRISFIPTGIAFYLNPALQTSNAGAEEGDIAWLRANGAIIIYVTNFSKPNSVNDLSAGTIYNATVQLNFTVPSSTNTIDYYECYANGLHKGTIKNSGNYIAGLLPSTNYNITVVAVDIFYNKSVVSNIINVTTANRVATDADAINYISASSNTAYQDIIDDLFISLKSNGLYSKIQAIYPFLGTTAGQHKFNAKNPVDSNTAFRLVFSGGGTFSNLGFQCNGTNAYANTFFTPSIIQNINNNGITLTCGTNNIAASTNVVEIGSYVSATQASYLIVKNNNTNYKRRAALNSETPECSQSGVNESRGIFTGSRQSATNTDLFINGVQIATGAQSGSLPNIPIFIGGINVAGSPATFSNQRIQFTAIHEGLSDSEVATFHSIIDTFEDTLGRKTW